jgi:hypothetical protein
MKKWDYQKKESSGSEIIETAKEEGQNGWELVAVIPFIPSAFHVQLIFKREIEPPEPPK